MLTIADEKYFVEKEASLKYGLSIHWFRRARYEHKGPPYHKFSSKIYYKEVEVDRWFKDNLLAVEK